MRSRARLVALALLLGTSSSATSATSAASAAGAAQSVPTAYSAVSPATMDAAIADLRHDPNLGGQTKVRTLRWVTQSQSQPPPTSPRWLIGLFDYVGQFAGLLLWIGGIGAAAVAVIWILRVLKSVEPRASPAQPEVGDRRVLDLDIHPDSLPDDVSAAAIELLRAGRLRDSLSLLYRASLSTAVHRFGVTLGDHHTEREVLKAVKGALDEVRARYILDLVAVWQRAVYAGEAVSPDAVLPLCAGFSTHFDPPPP